MTESYTPQDQFPGGDFVLPRNGDPVSYTTLISTIIKPVLDRSIYLYNRLGSAAVFSAVTPGAATTTNVTPVGIGLITLPANCSAFYELRIHADDGAGNVAVFSIRQGAKCVASTASLFGPVDKKAVIDTALNGIEADGFCVGSAIVALCTGLATPVNWQVTGTFSKK